MNWKLVNGFVNAIKHVNSIVVTALAYNHDDGVENELSSV